jgi:hypothetical protein
LGREEREQHVIQLYKEYKSVREIAKLVHMSFRDEVEREKGHLDEEDDIKSKSKITFY